MKLNPALLAAAALCPAGAMAQTAPAASTPPSSPQARAAAVEAQMTPDERIVLTHGVSGMPDFKGTNPPPDAAFGAGYQPGIPRLGVPSLKESDASLGVAYVGGARHDGGATPLPSGVAMAATWNPALIEQGGAVIGAEAKAKGFNVLLAGGVNLMRDPRGGRTFEYLSEDPVLTGILAGAAISGIQSNHMISTIKHFAFNNQETGRHVIDAVIDEPAARESDLLAFQIAIERSHPGAVMCAYNVVNGAHACDSDWLMNKVLKGDWGYPGFVLSDWGAVTSVQNAIHGLDQQSAAQYDPQVFLGDQLKAQADRDPAWAARLKDMNRRILYSIYANGLDRYPPVKGPIDAARGAAAAEAVEREGIVLLRNTRGALPLAAAAKRIVVIGGFAAQGVESGGGSSQVHMDGGPAVSLPEDDGSRTQAFQRSIPLQAIRAKAPNAQVVYRNGDYISDAVQAARSADAAIVFATQWQTEGIDVPDLSLPGGQDALIAAVAKANPNTIVVLETGSAVLMPWLNDTAAVVEAWYPGGRGGEAIASVLFGETNPSGRLPISFPASLDQLPRPTLDGLAQYEQDPHVFAKPGATLSANYNIEGSDVGYRWYARQGLTPLFPFGFGLSYSSFAYSDLKVTPTGANVTVTNTGPRAGQDTPQLYLTSAAGKRMLRLAGFAKLALQPGERRTVFMPIERRVLASWKDGRWTLDGGAYQFAVGHDAETLSAPMAITLPASRWK